MDISKILPFLFINECVVCGKEGEGAICNDCKKSLFVKGRARTLMGNPLYFITTYRLKGEKLIKEIKRGKVSPIPYLIDESLKLIEHERIDIVVPVPSMGFLFSYIPEHLLLMGKGIARKLDVRYLPIIEKVKRIRSQVTISPQERLRNPLGAFKLKMGAEKIIKDKRILIVDDVYTSGATMRECEREVLNHGGSSLSLVISKTSLLS